MWPAYLINYKSNQTKCIGKCIYEICALVSIVQISKNNLYIYKIYYYNYKII